MIKGDKVIYKNKVRVIKDILVYPEATYYKLDFKICHHLLTEKDLIPYLEITKIETEKTHKCLSNMQQHKISECPSLIEFREVKND